MDSTTKLLRPIFCPSYSSSVVQPIFPDIINIPHEVALRCLAYLPSFTRAIARCVSRAWRDALHPHSIHPIRQYLKLPIENWLFISMYSLRDYRWPLLDPRSRRIQRLSYPAWLTCGPLRPRKQFIRIIGIPDVVASACFFITVLSNGNYLTISLCHNADNNEWRSLPSMITRREFTFACAGLGKCMYVAGGNSRSNNRDWAKRAERYDSEQNAWEALPDMNFTRENCSGFSIDGKFYVIGGYDPLNRTIHTSAEFFDPKRGDWTVVPNMCPSFVGSNCRGRNRNSRSAVVDNTLYAAKHRSGEIFRYHQSNNSWTFSGSFDHTGLCTLLGLGDELWVFFKDRVEGLQAFACKPNKHQLEEPLDFRRIDMGFERCVASSSICGASSIVGVYAFG